MGAYANIVIFIVIVLGMKGPVFIQNKQQSRKYVDVLQQVQLKSI